MNLNINTITDVKVVAEFVTDKILKQLDVGKKVLFFVTGGSCIPIAVKISEILRNLDCKNLTVIMMDERYGPLGHADSNWQQLLEKGFNLPQAKLIPIIDGSDINKTTEKFNIQLEKEFKKADYKIGLFGVGKDGHTAGIIPNSEAVKAQNWACHHQTPQFERITITPKTVAKLDEAVVFMQGQEKWQVVEDLEKKDIDINLQPAQILKKVPLLTIFTDFKK
jgi:6-phosphogluconolactonase/glucosamine-6-phosphate isomerase/deaminase